MNFHARIPDHTDDNKLVIITGHDTGLIGIGEMDAKGKWSARLYDEDAITELQAALLTVVPEGSTAPKNRAARLGRLEESLRSALEAVTTARKVAEESTEDYWLDEAAGFVAGAAGDLERLHRLTQPVES